jgi:hypothetical protein
MKLILIFLFLAEVLMVLSQAGSIHFRYSSEAIPYFARLLQRQAPAPTSKSQANTRSSSKNSALNSGNDSVSNFEAMRENQLGKLDFIKNIHPMAQSDAQKSRSRSSRSMRLPKSPRNFKHLIKTYQEVFKEMNPNYGLVWFRTQIPLPQALRIALFLPILAFPFIFLGGLRRKMTVHNSYDKFLKSLRGVWFHKITGYQNFPASWEHWRNTGIQLKFQKESKSLKLKWFQILVKEGQSKAALHWGSHLHAKHPGDQKFNRQFCQLLLSLDEPLDFKFSKLISGYLQETRDENSAKRVWELTLEPCQQERLNSDVKTLAQIVAELTKNPDVKDFISFRT